MTSTTLLPTATRGDFLFFGALSLALHVAVFLLVTPVGGSEGAGMGGASALSVEGADVTLVTLVADWDRAPEVAMTPAEPVAPPTSEAAALFPTLAEPTPAAAAPALPVPDLPSEAPSLATEAPSPPETGPVAPEATALAAALPDTRPTPRQAPTQTRSDVPQPSREPSREPAPESAPESAPEAAPPAAAAAPAAQHRAAGSGEGTTAGRNSTGTGQSQSPERQAALVGEWSSAIQSRIARHQRYPSGNHGEGKVKVQMVIYRSGQLGDVTLAASSGRPALDAAALDAVRQAAPFPPAPDGLSDDWYQVAQWMSFRRR